jgi:hypothetical protein
MEGPMNVRRIAIPAAFTALGLVIGASASAQAEPQVVTKEVVRSVPVEKRVEVPVVKRVEVTPQVCLDAISAAQESFGIAAEFIEITSQRFPKLVVSAYEAGLNPGSSVEDAFISDTKDVTSDLSGFGDRLEPAGVRFRTAVAGCRGASA